MIVVDVAGAWPVVQLCIFSAWTGYYFRAALGRVAGPVPLWRVVVEIAVIGVLLMNVLLALLVLLGRNVHAA